jgi:hypothetical protein
MVAPQCLQAGQGILLAAGGGMKEMSDSESGNRGINATGTGRNYELGMAISGNAFWMSEKPSESGRAVALSRACALELSSG